MYKRQDCKIIADLIASGALARCQALCLNGNQIGDPGLASLADACARGALAQCQELDLSENQIGDVGLTAFAQAIKPVSEGGRGALATLKELVMDNGPLGTDHPQLKAACKTRGIIIT